MPYLDIGLVILIKQYNYILNEKKVKDKHPVISLIIINIFKIIVERTSKRYCGRPANRTTEGGIRDFGHVLEEGNISFLFIPRWQRECTDFYITESNTTGIVDNEGPNNYSAGIVNANHHCSMKIYILWTMFIYLLFLFYY